MEQVHTADIITLLSVITVCGTLLFLGRTYITGHWADKEKAREQERIEKDKTTETFIRTIAEATASNFLLNFAKDVNTKIDKLFEFREKDRENMDNKFNTVLKEVRK